MARRLTGLFGLFVFIGAFAVISGAIAIIALVVHATSGGGSFMGFAGEHFQLDSTPTENGHQSPYLIARPAVNEGVDVCAQGLAEAACKRDIDWLIMEKDLLIAEMRYVHYVLMKANDTIMHDGHDCAHNGYTEHCTPTSIIGTTLHREYTECFSPPPSLDKEETSEEKWCAERWGKKYCENMPIAILPPCEECKEKHAHHCLDEVVRAHPLEYCRLVKNGAGGYREHKDGLSALLESVAAVAGVEARVEDVCDRWRGEEKDERTVREVLLFADRFRIEGESVQPPSFALWYTEPAWNQAVADLHAQFHLAHELAHEVAPRMGAEVTEEICDARAADWVLGQEGVDEESARHAIVAVAQQLCTIGQRDRADALGKERSVRALFGCND